MTFEADQARVWVAHDDRTVELRRIKTGLIKGDLVEVRENLTPGEQLVTNGSVFASRPPGS